MVGSPEELSFDWGVPGKALKVFCLAAPSTRMMPASRIVDQLFALGTVRRQALISILSSTGITLVGYLATMYIAHAAGAEPLGAYFLFLAYYSMATFATDAGMGGAAVKRISEGRDQDAYYSAQFAVRSALLGIAVLAIFLASPLMVDFNQEGLFPWLVLALAAGSVGGMVSSGVYGGGGVGALQVAEFISTVVRVAVQVIAVYIGFGVAGLAGGFVAGVLAALAINLHFLRFRLGRFGLRHLASMAPYAGWGFLSAAVGVAGSYADTILVGYYLGSADVGYYRAPLQLASLALFAATPLATSLFPQVSRWREEGAMDAAAGALSRALTYALLVAVPFACGGLLLGERVLYFLYGSPFSVAAPAFALMLVAALPLVVATLDGMVLGALNQPRAGFVVNTISVAALVCLEAALIPAFGITGAAGALLIAYGARAVLTRAVLNRFLIVPLERGAILHVLLATAVMAAVIAPFRLFIPIVHAGLLAAVVAAGSFVFFTVLFRVDAGISGEIREMAGRLGIPWPRRLWKGEA